MPDGSGAFMDKRFRAHRFFNILGIVAASALASGCGKQSSAQSEGVATAAAPTSSSRGWQYHDETDKMRGTTDKFATIASTADPELQLEVRDMTSSGGMDILLEKDGNLFRCGMACEIPVQFDGGNVEKVVFGDGSTHGLGAILVYKEYKKKFLAKLKTAKHLVIEVSPGEQAEFDVAGLSWQ
jgi:hypothetical protein